MLAVHIKILLLFLTVVLQSDGGDRGERTTKFLILLFTCLYKVSFFF